MRAPDDGKPHRQRLPKLKLRLDFGGGRRIGPGKIELIEAVGRTGSIAAAGQAMGMSLRRSSLLVSAVNGMFEEPVVAGLSDDTNGGGAQLTAFGANLVAAYRRLEAGAQTLADHEMAEAAGRLTSGDEH